MKSSGGGGERSRLADGPVRYCEGSGSRCHDTTPQPLQLLLAVLPQLLISSSAAEGGALTQAGDVGPATWWRHDALGVPAGNIVVNLSS